MIGSRSEICRRLVEIQRKVEPDLLRIEELKDQLRELVDTAGEGFVEQVDCKGTVEAKVGCGSEFKGLLPVLIPASYIALSETKQKKLRDDGLVEMKQQWSSPRKPSVTVRL